MGTTSPHRDEIDWKELRTEPRKLFGYSYIYVLLVLVGVGMLYLSQLTLIGKNSVYPTILKDSAALIQDIPMQTPRIIPPVDVMKVGIASPALVSKGQELFQANCSSCHGTTGQGDGPSAPMMNPKPRNFHSPENWKNGVKVTQLYKTLEEGIPGSGMASYNYMSPEERFALIHYIRTFASNPPLDSLSDLRQLDSKYALAKGMNVAGQMPIKKAMALAEKENGPSLGRIHNAAIQADASHEIGAELLRRTSYDERRVFTAALRMKSSAIRIDDFTKIISDNPLQYGFKPMVARLSASEWNELYRFVFLCIREE